MVFTSNNRLMVNINGCVGMSCTSPTYKLHVTGTGRFSLSLTDYRKDKLNQIMRSIKLNQIQKIINKTNG